MVDLSAGYVDGRHTLRNFGVALEVFGCTAVVCRYDDAIARLNVDFRGSGIDQILAGEDAEVFVYDFTGRVIMHKTEVNSQDEVIKNLNSGNYIIKAISNVGSKSFKVIIP